MSALSSISVPVVSLEQVCFKYERASAPILADCSVSFERGIVSAILGPNGCGKTTLLRLILGELKPTYGGVTVQEPLAFVPQLFTVSFDYSVLDMVLMGRARKIGLFALPSRADVELAQQMLDRFGLADLAQKQFQTLSGGQRQLAVFARALVAQSPILLLDEPTSALDLKNQSLVLHWIWRLAEEDGLTVIFTTHQPSHALAVASSVVLMESGLPAAQGPAGELLKSERLTKVYGLPLKRVMFTHEGKAQETVVPVFSSPLKH